MGATPVTTRTFIARIGRSLSSACEQCGQTLALFIRTLGNLRYIFAARRDIVDQMYYYGAGSVAVTAVFAFFSGMIIAYNTGLVLSQMGLGEAIGSVAAIVFCREWGPIMTAIILTARVGSSMTAEIGTMRVSEEIDALEVMGIDPVRFLVMPRVVALALVTVALTLMSDIIGIFGSAVIGHHRINVEYMTFYNSATSALRMVDVYCGMTKAFVYGALISIVACVQGLRTTGGARGVGRATMISVVASLVFIIIFDLFITRLFFPET
ncbi:MAG: ABC transporter permease [Planctomycetota bacterium]